jgi:alanine dehydrogenase
MADRDGIWLRFLSGPERVHLMPDNGGAGHFNVLRGHLNRLGEHGVSGVKVVGDFVPNYTVGLPSELAMATLFDPTTGVPLAVLDATMITAARTGAMTTVGACHLARPDSKILGHAGARGTAWWNVTMLDDLFDLDEIRVTSRRPESLLRTAAIKPGAFVVPYGTVSAVELDLLDVMDKVVVDDWREAQSGRFGSLRRHVDTGRLSPETLYAELGQIVSGRMPGRETDAERNLFWHRGLSLLDVAIAHLILRRAEAADVGTMLRFH